MSFSFFGCPPCLKCPGPASRSPPPPLHATPVRSETLQEIWSIHCYQHVSNFAIQKGGGGVLLIGSRLNCSHFFSAWDAKSSAGNIIATFTIVRCEQSVCKHLTCLNLLSKKIGLNFNTALLLSSKTRLGRFQARNPSAKLQRNGHAILLMMQLPFFFSWGRMLVMAGIFTGRFLGTWFSLLCDKGIWPARLLTSARVDRYLLFSNRRILSLWTHQEERKSTEDADSYRYFLTKTRTSFYCIAQGFFSGVLGTR